MRSQSRGLFVSGLVLSLTFAAAGGARAQSGFPGVPDSPGFGQVGTGLGSVSGFGFAPSDLGVTCSGGCGPTNPAIWSASDSFGPSWPQTDTYYTSMYEYQSSCNTVSIVPGWDRPSHRSHRRR